MSRSGVCMFVFIYLHPTNREPGWIGLPALSDDIMGLEYWI